MTTGEALRHHLRTDFIAKMTTFLSAIEQARATPPDWRVRNVILNALDHGEIFGFTLADVPTVPEGIEQDLRVWRLSRGYIAKVNKLHSDGPVLNPPKKKKPTK